LAIEWCIWSQLQSLKDFSILILKQFIFFFRHYCPSPIYFHLHRFFDLTTIKSKVKTFDLVSDCWANYLWPNKSVVRSKVLKDLKSRDRMVPLWVVRSKVLILKLDFQHYDSSTYFKSNHEKLCLVSRPDLFDEKSKP
jgi:hypothetical protein